MGTTGLSLYLAALLFGSGFSGNTIAVDKPLDNYAISQQIDINENENEILALINIERQRSNLPMLKMNSLLSLVARKHCKEMADKDYFGHISPTKDYETPMKRYVKELGHIPKWAIMSENISYCSVPNIYLSHESLMNSTSHRGNILSKRFTEVGIGTYTDSDGKFWVTQIFLNQMD